MSTTRHLAEFLAGQTISIVAAEETDTALQIFPYRAAIDTAVETDTAPAITTAFALQIALAPETDTALTVPALFSVTLTPALETDIALILPIPPVPIVMATETDEALVITYRFIYHSGQIVHPPSGPLGCGTYRVLLYERGGEILVSELPFSQLSFQRVLNDIGPGRVTVPLGGGLSESCSDALRKMDSWSHEIHFWRNRTDSQPAFVGIVQDPTFSRKEVTIDLKDLFQWFERRTLRQDRHLLGDLADIFEGVVDDALYEDNGMNVSVAPFTTGKTSKRVIVGADRVYAAGVLRDIAREGLDFTVRGREILAGGVEILLPGFLQLWDNSVLNASVTQRGSEMGTRVSAGNLPKNLWGIGVGEMGGVDEKYGLVEISTKELSGVNDKVMQQIVESKYKMVRRPPAYLTATLSPDAPFDLKDLVPGVRADVRLSEKILGVREVVEEMRLASVSVSASKKGEDISSTFIPLGETG